MESGLGREQLVLLEERDDHMEEEEMWEPQQRERERGMLGSEGGLEDEGERADTAKDREEGSRAKEGQGTKRKSPKKGVGRSPEKLKAKGSRGGLKKWKRMAREVRVDVGGSPLVEEVEGKRKSNNKKRESFLRDEEEEEEHRGSKVLKLGEFINCNMPTAEAVEA